MTILSCVFYHYWYWGRNWYVRTWNEAKGVSWAEGSLEYSVRYIFMYETPKGEFHPGHLIALTQSKYSDNPLIPPLEWTYEI